MSNYVTKTFSLEWMKEEDLPWSDYTVSLETEDVGRRWMDVTTCVFEDPDEAGAFYEFCFDEGKTEYQDQRWYEELEDEVVCTRVEQVDVVVKQWKPIKRY